MALIVERISRAGRVLAQYRFDQPCIRIGRAYDNDLILADPHVDPHHAELLTELEDGTPLLRDNGSLNGTLLERRQRVTAPVALEPGQVITLGKSCLRVIDSRWPVPPATPVAGIDNLLHSLSLGTAAVTLLLLLATLALSTYLDSATEFKLEQMVTPTVGVILLLLLYAGFWALVGRVVRHDGRFLTHCTVFMVGMLLLQAGESVVHVVSFNLRFMPSLPYFNTALFGVVLFAMLWTSLRLASHFARRTHLAVAMAPSLLLAVVIVANLHEDSAEFDPHPSYDATLLPPVVQFFTAVPSKEFLARGKALFVRQDGD